MSLNIKNMQDLYQLWILFLVIGWWRKRHPIEKMLFLYGTTEPIYGDSGIIGYSSAKVRFYWGILAYYEQCEGRGVTVNVFSLPEGFLWEITPVHLGTVEQSEQYFAPPVFNWNCWGSEMELMSAFKIGGSCGPSQANFFERKVNALPTASKNEETCGTDFNSQ